MQQLLIDDNELQLSPDTRIGVTLQVNDIAELNDRQATYTNEFKIPKTNKNKQLLGNCDRVDSNTSFPYSEHVVKFIQDGVELISSGIPDLKEAGDNYAMSVYSGIADFFSQIEGLKLSDLDLSDLDHTWSYADIIHSMANTDGYIYALVDYSSDGEAFQNESIELMKLFPSIYVHTLVRKIFEQTDYSFSGDIITLDKYLKLILPYSLDSFTYPDDLVNGALFKARYGHNANELYELNFIHNFYPATSFSLERSTGVTPFIDETSLGFFDNGNNFNSQIFKAPINGKYTFNNRMNTSVYIRGITTSGGLVTVTIRTKLYKNGNYVTHQDSTPYSDYTYNMPVDWGYSQTGNFVYIYQAIINDSSFEIELSKNDTVYVETELLVSSTFTGYINYAWDITLKYYYDSYLSNSLLNAITWGGDVYMNCCLPDITQKDFLKSIANMLGIIFIPNNDSKNIEFVQFKKLYDNLPLAKDWSKKLAENEEQKISFRASTYAQKNNCLYTPDDTNLLSGLGNSFFNINDKNLDGSKDVITLPYAASEEVVRLKEAVYHPDGYSVINVKKLEGFQFKNNTKTRICYVDIVTIDYFSFYKVTVNGNPSGNYGYPYFPLTYFNRVDEMSLNWARLLEENYKELTTQMLNEYKSVVAKFNLTINDVADFDHMIPIYIEKYGAYFYVNTIKEFMKGKLTEVQLIRM